MAIYHQYPFMQAKDLPEKIKKALATHFVCAIKKTPGKVLQLLDTLRIHLFPSDFKAACLVFDELGKNQAFPFLMEVEFTDNITNILTGLQPDGNPTHGTLEDDINKNPLDFPYKKAINLEGTKKASLGEEIIHIASTQEHKAEQLLDTLKICVYPDSHKLACLAFAHSSSDVVTPIFSEFELSEEIMTLLKDVKPQNTHTTITFDDEIEESGESF